MTWDPESLQRLRADGGMQWTFDSTEQRDEWLKHNYSNRKCGDSPGFYHLPDGKILQVFMETVTLYPPRFLEDRRQEAIEMLDKLRQLYDELARCAVAEVTTHPSNHQLARAACISAAEDYQEMLDKVLELMGVGG